MNMVMNMDRWRDSRLDRLGRWMEERERQRERERSEKEKREREGGSGGSGESCLDTS